MISNSSGDRHPNSLADEPKPLRFVSVRKAAKILGISAMTLYREVDAGKFPAVRIRTRILIPLDAIEDMARAAAQNCTAVDSVDWASEPDGRTGSDG